jgi:BirA family transcriptional regulator, biotin operon repressor / biotin---[acetyl-CoA-carboxylase] ligase
LTSLYASAETIWQAAMVLQEPALAGFSVEVLPEIDSTNTELMRRARAGRSEATLLVAQRQTAGKGRLGRPWHSGATQQSPLTESAPQASAAPTEALLRADGASLTFSIGLLLEPQAWDGLSLAVGVSVAESLHKDLQLKWPNDLWWQGRKLAGILIETASVGAQRYAVVGVGINIAPRPAAGLSTLPACLQELEPATTDAHALERIAAPLLRDLLLFERQGFAPFAARFAARDALRGHSVTVIEQPTTVPSGFHSDLHGTAQGVDGQGALLLQTAAGVRRIHSSEVSVRPLLVGH